MSQQITSPDDLDKWFEELEASLDKDEVARLAQNVLERHKPSLEEKVLADFHGNAPIIDENYNEELPKLTNKAKIYISNILEKNEDFFRVSVVGGGCSGFQYEFSLENELGESDIIFSKDPKAVTDDESIKYLRGAEIEWQKEAFSGQMVVNNPGAKMGCGCGSSFMYDFDLVPTNS